MGEMTDKIVDVTNNDKKVKEIRKQIKELREANTELRKQTLNKGLPTNVRDNLFATIDENKELIEELLKDLNTPVVVPLTNNPIVANHKYDDTSSFGKSSFRF